MNIEHMRMHYASHILVDFFREWIVCTRLEHHHRLSFPYFQIKIGEWGKINMETSRLNKKNRRNVCHSSTSYFFLDSNFYYKCMQKQWTYSEHWWVSSFSQKLITVLFQAENCKLNWCILIWKSTFFTDFSEFSTLNVIQFVSIVMVCCWCY